MTARSDRQRIEAAIPPRLVWQVAATIASDTREKTDAEGARAMAEIVAGLERAVNAALGDDIGDDHKRKLARRLYRTCRIVTGDLENRPIATALVASREIVARLTVAGAWEGADDFYAAWDRLADAIYGEGEDGEANARTLEAVDRSGTRYGAKAIGALQAEGYYRGVSAT